MVFKWPNASVGMSIPGDRNTMRTFGMGCTENSFSIVIFVRTALFAVSASHVKFCFGLLRVWTGSILLSRIYGSCQYQEDVMILFLAFDADSYASTRRAVQTASLLVLVTATQLMGSRTSSAENTGQEGTTEAS
ncbi:hypothetical protein BJ912DRAFT_1043404 [Pholiota molesta]|nr:hypothetical protein BJ912DRAFT_1043404 [Pholiota molesta]